MDSVPMPRDLSEEAVARLLWDAQRPDVDRFAWEQIDRVSKDGWLRMARAVRALLREKVRECIAVTETRCHMPRFAPKDKAYGSLHPGATDDEIVARVMGEEAPRA